MLKNKLGSSNLMRDKRKRIVPASRKLIIGIATAFLAIMIAGNFAYAQSTGRGNITGTVSDPSGAVVAGASVIATNVATNVSTAATTNKTGYFEIDSLDAGQYRVSVSAPGFEKFVQNGIILNSSAVLTLPLGLKVGRQTEVVTVTEQAPLLNVESGLNGQSSPPCNCNRCRSRAITPCNSLR